MERNRVFFLPRKIMTEKYVNQINSIDWLPYMAEYECILILCGWFWNGSFGKKNNNTQSFFFNFWNILSAPQMKRRWRIEAFFSTSSELFFFVHSKVFLQFYKRSSLLFNPGFFYRRVACTRRFSFDKRFEYIYANAFT